MSEERRMRELGKLAREERALADDEVTRELVRPLTTEELAAIAGRTAEALTDARAESREHPRTRPIKRARARPRLWLVAAALAPLAIAAGVALWVRQGLSDENGSLATYELVVEGGERASRTSSPAPAEEPTLVTRNGRLTLVARPRARGPAGVTLRAMILHEGALQSWSVPVRMSAEGAGRIDAAANELAQLPMGPSQIVLFVGQASHLPTDAASARRALDAPQAGVQVLKVDVVMR